MSLSQENGIDIKRINRNRIYRLIYQSERISKQDISYRLGMSLPTITQNLKYLQEQGLIRENGTFESTGGRKARAIVCVMDARIALGLDITRNHIGIVAVDLRGNIIRNIRASLRFEADEDYFQRVGALLREFVEALEVPKERILGVGISVPGILSEDHQTVVYATVLGFTGGTLERFSRYIPYPCVMCNDANAAGNAEMWNEQKHGNIIYLSLSNTVGGSVFVDNHLYTGDHQRGGEFGHMTIVPGGKLCYCGKEGCVDAYCSVRALLDGLSPNLTDFFERLRRGEPAICRRFEEYKKHLTVTCNNLRMAFDCEIILGGYLGGYLEEHLESLREVLKNLNTFEEYGGYIRVCHYRLEAAAVGAALLHVSPFLAQI